jgi:transposase
MAQAVSIDLRRRLARAIAQGKSRRAAAAQFEVAPSTAVRLQQRLDRTGSLEPGRRGRPAGGGKLAPCRALIIAKVKEQPDITMPDLAAWLFEREGISVDPSNLSKLLCKAGFTFKKNLDGSGAGSRRYQTRAR